jgi:hypothetical protein
MDDTTTSPETAERFAELLHESSNGLPVDVTALVSVGMDRGRVRLRRQRRTVATSMAAAGVVGVVALATTVLPGRAAQGVNPAGSVPAPATSAISTAATPAAKLPVVKRQPVVVRDIPVRAAELPKLFTDLYPGKVTPAEERTGRIIDNGRHGVNAAQIAHFLWNGKQTSVVFAAFAGTPIQRCNLLKSDGRIRTTCTERPDGTVLMAWWDKDPDVPGSSAQSVALLTNHGYSIEVISYNTAGKHLPALSAQPPFSIDQMTKAVTSTHWFTHR